MASIAKSGPAPTTIDPKLPWTLTACEPVLIRNLMTAPWLKPAMLTAAVNESVAATCPFWSTIAPVASVSAFVIFEGKLLVPLVPNETRLMWEAATVMILSPLALLDISKAILPRIVVSRIVTLIGLASTWTKVPAGRFSAMVWLPMVNISLTAVGIVLMASVKVPLAESAGIFCNVRPTVMRPATPASVIINAPKSVGPCCSTM